MLIIFFLCLCGSLMWEIVIKDNNVKTNNPKCAFFIPRNESYVFFSSDVQASSQIFSEEIVRATELSNARMKITKIILCFIFYPPHPQPLDVPPPQLGDPQLPPQLPPELAAC